MSQRRGTDAGADGHKRTSRFAPVRHYCQGAASRHCRGRSVPGGGRLARTAGPGLRVRHGGRAGRCRSRAAPVCEKALRRGPGPSGPHASRDLSPRLRGDAAEDLPRSSPGSCNALAMPRPSPCPLASIAFTAGNAGITEANHPIRTDWRMSGHCRASFVFCRSRSRKSRFRAPFPDGRGRPRRSAARSAGEGPLPTPAATAAFGSFAWKSGIPGAGPRGRTRAHRPGVGGGCSGSAHRSPFRCARALRAR